MIQTGAAEITARSAGEGEDLRAWMEKTSTDLRAQPLLAHVTLSVDGETLARVTAKAGRNAAARSFLPVPVME